MRIYVLGQLTVEAGDAVARERNLPGNQARVALAMLAVEHKHPLSRDQIADELWPERLPASWETALRAVISKVRSTLNAAGLASDLIRSAFGCYQLCLGDGWLDLDAAADALHNAQADLARGNPVAATANATVTCLICSRPFLPGHYGPWTLRQRDRINNLHLHGQQCLAEARARIGDFERSAHAAEVALSLDPYREATYQRLIRSRALAGDRIGAASVFNRYRDLIETELGIEPTPETIAAFQEAIAGTDTHRT
ncbi:MAG: AfsR/SARP family transcriptional regulator [Solirubrobacteraceae bacterium]